MFMFAKMFELVYGFPVIIAKTGDSGADLKDFSFLRVANLATCKQHIRVDEIILTCHQALKFAQGEAP